LSIALACASVGQDSQAHVAASARLRLAPRRINRMGGSFAVVRAGF